jgi:hypothetical protein
MPDWSELLSEMTRFEPPDDLTARVLGGTGRARLMTGGPAAGRHRRRLSRSLSIAGGFAAVAIALLVLAIAAHSRRETASPSGPAPLTAANLRTAIQAHGLGRISAMPHGDPCRASQYRVDFGFGAILKRNPSGFPLTQVSSTATFLVMPSAELADACRREALRHDLYPLDHITLQPRPSPYKRISSSVIVDLNEGGPGTVPILRHGDVLRDGAYEVIASRGRILLLGITADRPDALALARVMKAVADDLAQ